MYRLPIFLLVAVGAALATDLSQNIPRGDAYEYHLHRMEHLRKARIELQRYYDNWVQQKYKARSETVTEKPHSSKPTPYYRWLSNPQEPTKVQSFSRTRNVYTSTSPIPAPYGSGHFHLYHLHRQNGDQMSWSQAEPQQHYSYSYVYGKRPVSSPSCEYPPCLETSQYLPSQPVYNNQMPAYIQYQDQPAYQAQQDPWYSQYYGTQTYNQYPQPQPVKTQHVQPQPTNQESDPNNVFLYNRLPIYQNSPVLRPTYPTEFNKVSTRYPPYQYQQYSHKYPSAGPQCEPKPMAEGVPPVLNELIQASVTEQHHSGSASSNIATTAPTPQQLEENSTTESTPTEKTVTYFAEQHYPISASSNIATATHTSQQLEENSTMESTPTEEIVTISAEKPALTSTQPNSTTERSFHSTNISSSTGDGLTSEIPGVVYDVEAGHTSKPTTVVGTTNGQITSAESSLPTSSPVDDMETSATMKPTLLDVDEYEEGPTTVLTHNGLTQTATETHSTTESTVDFSTSTASSLHGVSTEGASKYTEPEYTTVQAEKTAKESTTVSQEKTTSIAETILTTTGVPVFLTTDKEGSTYKDTTTTTTLRAVETTSLSPTTVNEDLENQTSTREISPTTTEVYATTWMVEKTPKGTVIPFSETDAPRSTTSQYVTIPTTQVPVQLTTTEGGQITTDRPNGGSTEIYTSMANGITTHPEDAVSELTETTPTIEMISEVPIGTTTTQGESAEVYFTVKTTLTEDESTTMPPLTEFTSGLIYGTAPSKLSTVIPAAVTGKISARQSDSIPTWTLPKKNKAYSKDLVRREDSWAQRRLEKRITSSAVKNITSDSKSNMISENLEMTARGDKLSAEDLEACFLKQLIHVVSAELREGKLSKQDEKNLRELFGDMWTRILDEAYNGNPVKVSSPDQAVATRALRYFINGSPLARRLGKKSVNIGKVLRIKRESQKSALQQWQKAVLRSILSREGRLLTTEVEDETYRVVLRAIKEQLNAPPPEEYDYADEDDEDDTTKVNRNGDSEYYDEDDEDVDNTEEEARA